MDASRLGTLESPAPLFSRFSADPMAVCELAVDEYIGSEMWIWTAWRSTREEANHSRQAVHVSLFLYLIISLSIRRI